MKPPAFWDDPDAILAADTSVVINLVDSGRAALVVKAIPNRLVVPSEVFEELKAGEDAGHEDAGPLRELIRDGLVSEKTIGDDLMDHYKDLLAGETEKTLGDGEVATIACAMEWGYAPVLDDNKARSLLCRMESRIECVSSVDLFAHASVAEALGNDEFANAVFNALFEGNMRVMLHDEKWVIDLIGVERAARCSCLKKALERYRRKELDENPR